MKKIIINADDWGLSPLFNKGILALMKKGIISSTTVMINQKYIEPEKLLNLDNISIGLHLELDNKSKISEVEEQIIKFKQVFNKYPSHLDGHQHCHIFPEHIGNVVKVAKKYSLPVRSRFNEDREFFIKNKIKTVDLFLSWHPKRIDELIKKINNINANVSEVVCHPGYFDKNCNYSYNKQREKELKFLQSSKFLAAIKKFQLMNYYEL